MQASRSTFRLTRTLRPRTQILRARRYESTSGSSSAASQSGATNTAAIVGGVVGGSLVFLGGYAWYHFSGAKTFVNTAQSAKSYFDQAFKKSTEKAPAPSEALQWLRQTTSSYAAFIPGAKGYVDTAFDDLDAIHEKHGSEVDKIVSDTYNELKNVSKEGASMQTVTKAWDILQQSLKRIGDLAGDAADDVLKNHPELKDKFDQLKSQGDQYGPEAKKKIEDTMQQVKDILKGGLGVGTVDKLRKLVQEKSEELKQFGDQAWQKGMEQAKPYLDKSPKVKEFVEKNKDKLMQGDLGQLWEKLQAAAKSGDVGELEKIVKEQGDKAKGVVGGSGGGVEQYLKMIPGGEEIGSKLGQLQDLAQKHGEEAEKLVKDAFKEMKDVLSKKVDEGQKLANKAKDDAKK